MSIPFRLRIPRRLYDAMLNQALAELPNECCGLLAGRIVACDPDEPGVPVALAEEIYPLVNAAASPVEYLSEPRSMFDAVRAMRRQDLDILAIYHSHPNSDPVPSRKDLERNFSEDVINLIVSLKEGNPRVRGWWLTADDYHEADGHLQLLSRSSRNLTPAWHGLILPYMATVVITPEAFEQVDGLPRVMRARVRRLVAKLENWPTVSGAKPLSGRLAGHYRLRTGDYRVQFRVDGDTVIVEKVGHRDRFYED